MNLFSVLTEPLSYNELKEMVNYTLSEETNKIYDNNGNSIGDIPKNTSVKVINKKDNKALISLINNRRQINTNGIIYGNMVNLGRVKLIQNN